jgi:hypothetical protein
MFRRRQPMDQSTNWKLMGYDNQPIFMEHTNLGPLQGYRMVCF